MDPTRDGLDLPGIFIVAALFILAIFALIVGLIIRTALQANAERRRNNAQPVQTVPAVVVNRREDLRGGGETRVHTIHYVTFELADGSRLEMRVQPKEYGLLVVGDRGQLSHQGTRFKGFVRHR